MQPVFDHRWHCEAKAGHAGAIDALARAAVEPLYRFCFYRVGRNRHLCEEVVQETLVRAIGQLGQYDPARANGQIFPWLTGLARNEIRRVLARENAAHDLQRLWARMDRQLREVYARLESEPLAEDVLRRDETREMVGATMSQLPPQYREVLEAMYVAGKSMREIAAALGISEKAIESRLSRAREAFRATFLALAGSLDLESP